MVDSRAFAVCCMLLAATSLFASDPAGVLVLDSGELAILDFSGAIFKVSGTAKPTIVRDFGLFQPADFTSARLGNEDTLLVTLHLTVPDADMTFSRLSRRLARNGARVGEWPLSIGGGALVGVAVDPRTSIAYCSDSLLGNIYRIDLRSRNPAFATVATVREPSTLGPIAFDAKRQRLLVGDLRKGRIFGVALSNGQVSKVLDAGTIREPLGMALDPASDRLYIADATRERVWVGTFNPDGSMNVRAFETPQKFREPIGVAVSEGLLWVVDREAKQVIQLSPDGIVRKRINL